MHERTPEDYRDREADASPATGSRCPSCNRTDGCQCKPFLLNERLRGFSGMMADSHQELATHHKELFSTLPGHVTVQTFTECASKVGIAVSLIEGMIAISRILWMMDLSSTEVQEALKDLKGILELELIMTSETEEPGGRMVDEEWRNRDKEHHNAD